MSRRSSLLSLILVSAIAFTVPAGAASKGLALSASGAEGVATHPGAPSGAPCDAADAVGFEATADLAPGAFTSVPGTLDLSLGILPDGGGAFLAGGSATLSNERGVASLLLSSGSCGAPTLAYDGSHVAGTGTWTVDPDATTGSFRELVGSGTFQLQAATLSGAGNPWTLDLNGTVAVHDPSLVAEVAEATWRHRPGDPGGRIVTATFAIANEGPGDAYAGTFAGPDAPAGFELLSVEPAAFGAVPAGEAREVTARWAVDGLKGRSFEVTLHLAATDALDNASQADPTVAVSVPTKG